MDSVGEYAVRHLAIDVGNLTARLAVATSALEVMSELAMQLVPDTWERPSLPPGEDLRPPAEMNIVVVPGPQAEIVMQILTLIRSVQ